jgi:Xaa-Pro aminopeptidase
MKTTIQITPEEFAERRATLISMLDDDAIALIPSASLQIRNRDAEYPFRQNSDFLYLTGFNEPDALAVIIPGREQGEFLLFCRERDPKAEQWVGRRAGLEGVISDFGADDSFPITDVDDILPGLMEGRKTVYYSMGNDPQFDTRVMGWVNALKAKVRSGVHSPHEMISLDMIVHEMRLYKSKAEVRLMKHAAKASIRAHRKAMKRCKPEMWEYEVDAIFDYEFKKSGMVPAYTSIVGGGENACILHYIDNNQCLQDGDLLLIDAGAEYNAYASDITRTFPVNGKFSEPQKQLYQLVLDAQKAAIAAAVPGNHWDDPHQAAVRVLTRGLVKLGLLSGNVDQLIKDDKHRRFYMHKTGHWLGMDVHDVGDYKLDDAWRILEPGMVLTVEPGLYISPANDIDEKWWNIGIRIEDDVLITRQGNEVLTGALEKEVDEIEAIMA